MITISTAEQNAFQSALPKTLTLSFPFNTLTNEDIFLESAKLEQAICEESNLTFGMVYSSQFSVRIFDDGNSYTGQTVIPTLSVTDGNTTYTRSLGTFVVKSDKLTSDKLYRDLICYDYLADVLPVDFSEWHNNMPSTFTLKQYRDAFFSEIQVVQDNITLPNDSVTLTKFTVTEFSGADILACILQLTGTFGFIAANGEFKYVIPKTTNDYLIDDNSFIQGSLVYEDEPIQQITGVTIKGFTDDYGDEGSYSVDDATAGDDTGSVLTIENNNLIQACNLTTRQTLCTNLFNSIEDYTYNPTQVKLPVYIGLEPGDVFKIETDRQDIYFPVLKRTLSGISQLLDEVEANGESDITNNANSVSSGVSSAQIAINQVRESVAELLAGKAAIWAQEAAISANHSAQTALTQLSVVEDVAGTLQWISQHGDFVATQDTSVQEGTVYFELINGEYVPIVNPDPEADPSEEGWYVLDVTESQSRYIMAHLAVTDAGLWILPVDGNVQYDLADSDGNMLVDSDGNQIITYSPEPNNAAGYKILISATASQYHPVGVTIYNDQGTAVANYGTTITLGETGRPRLQIYSQGMGLLNATDQEIFGIKPDQAEYENKTATVATYQTSSDVQAGTLPFVSDTSASTYETPFIELTINGITETFDTGVTATTTSGSGVSVTVSSAGATAILSKMQYETTVDTYDQTQDHTVDSDKTYYSKSGDIYTEVIPVGDEDPSDEGWYEKSSTTTTSYYPCTMTVEYSAVTNIKSAIMDLIGRIEITGTTNILHAINNEWSQNKLSDTFVRATNNTTGTSVAFGVGSGGDNHGIWSTPLGAWLIYGSHDGLVRIPKVALIGSSNDYSSTTNGTRISAGDIRVSKTGATSYVQVRSGNHVASFTVTTEGAKGIYDNENAKWVIYSLQAGSVVIPQNLKCNGFYRTNNTSIYRIYTYNGVSRYGFGSGNEVLRFVTHSVSSTNTGNSFMIGNGGYAVGSANGEVDINNAQMFLCGGADSSGLWIKSYTTYNRTYSGSSVTNVVMTSTGTFGRVTSSSIRYKHDVEYLTNEENSTIDKDKKSNSKSRTSSDPTDILDIPVVTFKFNEGYVTGEADYDYDKPVMGMIAEDVAKVAPDCATYIEDEKGEKIPEAWNADQLLVRMLYVVQQQEKRIQELEARVAKLEGGK